ncbi:hypothetical protein [Pseudoalteromonas rubra]|uniref:hypothetical protein n=1 Tax=Pseudoalteromonas rubra TaxID=43658 RepID=UPI000F7677BE|nr:hypothetical protein [Pseudoalteromonas rubra]
MSDALQAQDIAAVGNEIRSYSDDKIKQAFTQGLEITVRQLKYLAMLWKEMEHRDMDLSAYRTGMGRFIELIANNQIMAELVFKYAGHNTLLNAIRLLPADEQQTLAQQQTITLVEPDKTGTAFVEREIAPELIPSRYIQHVFSEFGVRTRDQQKERLMKLKLVKKQRTKAIPRRARKVELDAEHNVLILSDKVSLDVDKALDVIGQSYGLDGDQVKQLLAQHQPD